MDKAALWPAKRVLNGIPITGSADGFSGQLAHDADFAVTVEHVYDFA